MKEFSAGIIQSISQSKTALLSFATGALSNTTDQLRATTAATLAYIRANGLLGTSMTLVRGGFSGFWNLLKNGISGTLTGIGTALRFVGQSLLFVGRVALLNPVGLVITAIALAGIALIKYWQPVKAFFTGFWEGLTEGLLPLRKALGPLFNALTAALSPLVGLWDLLAGALSKAWGWLSKLFAPFQSTRQELEGATSAGRRFGLILANVLNAVIGLPGKFFSFGGMLIDGLIGGFTNKLTSLKDAITGAGTGISNWFKDTLGIRSPSKVFISHGGDVMAGLEQGLGDNKKVLKPVDQLSKKLKQAGAGLTLGTVALSTAAAPQLSSLQPAALPAIDSRQPLKPRIDNRPPLSRQQRTQPTQPAPISVEAIHIHAAPGMDEQAVAQLVMRELERLQAQQAAANRSNLSDED